MLVNFCSIENEFKNHVKLVTLVCRSVAVMAIVIVVVVVVVILGV